MCSELAELHSEIGESDVEASKRVLIEETLDQLRLTAMTLQQGLEWLRLPQDKHGLVALLIDERLRRASQLNLAITEDFEAGRIRTDQEGLSAYLRVLNQVMTRTDQILGSRNIER